MKELEQCSVVNEKKIRIIRIMYIALVEIASKDAVHPGEKIIKDIAIKALKSIVEVENEDI